MGNGLTATAASQVARVFRDGTLAGMSDRLVLERFIEDRDETAFEAILYRHGAMVRNVCRQMLFDPHDVEDAVQAVFLVLVRKARFIRVEGSLGPWLYTVAGRVAARAARIGERSALANAKHASYPKPATRPPRALRRFRVSSTPSSAGFPNGCVRRWCSVTSKG